MFKNNIYKQLKKYKHFTFFVFIFFIRSTVTIFGGAGPGV